MSYQVRVLGPKGGSYCLYAGPSAQAAQIYTHDAIMLMIELQATGKVVYTHNGGGAISFVEGREQ